MKFCTECGRTLSILNEHNGDICSKCAPKVSIKQTKSPDNQDILKNIGTAVLSIKKGKIVLESEEGWLLWSGETIQNYTLQTILDKANRILKIRKRQKK